MNISQKNFPNRVKEARALAKFAKIVKDNGKVFEVLLPGHEAKNYRVILKWLKTTGGEYILQSECHLHCGFGWRDCRGNSYNVCYHSLAAVVAIAEAHDANVAFALTEKDANRLVNMNTNANRLISKQSVKCVWIVS